MTQVYFDNIPHPIKRKIEFINIARLNFSFFKRTVYKNYM